MLFRKNNTQFIVSYAMTRHGQKCSWKMNTWGRAGAPPCLVVLVEGTPGAERYPASWVKQPGRKAQRGLKTSSIYVDVACAVPQDAVLLVVQEGETLQSSCRAVIIGSKFPLPVADSEVNRQNSRQADTLERTVRATGGYLFTNNEGILKDWIKEEGHILW